MATRVGQVLNKELDLYAQFWDIVREGQEVSVLELKQTEAFVVLENTPGYLPENDDPPTFRTQNEAWAYLVEEVQRYVDHMKEVDFDVSVIGHPEFGYAEVEDGGLGRVFYINSTEPHDFP